MLRAKGVLVNMMVNTKNKLKKKENPLCACGCGERVAKPNHKYIFFHFKQPKKAKIHKFLESNEREESVVNPVINIGCIPVKFL